MLKNQLELKIYNYVGENRNEPTLIVMSPKTWMDLMLELYRSDKFPNYLNSNELRYRGIKVLRSLDVKDNEFEI